MSVPLPSQPLSSIATGARRPMSRDKSDALLLLIACTLVLAPHVEHTPLWVAISCLTILLWRGWITFSGSRMPPRWLLIPIATCAMAGVYATFKTFFGQDAGVAMLTLLLTLKLLEMHAKRDLFVVIFLSFFLMLVNFLYTQTIGTAALTIVTLVMVLTAQVSFQYTGEVPSLKRRLKLSLFIIALAAPLMLVLFILFPRVQGPLWGLPSSANAARTGLSDTMAPGNISNLARSEEIAFRVKFIDPAPPKSSLYWRGIVLGNYDGTTWTRKSPRIRTTTVDEFNPRGNPIRHQVTLEPNGHRWIFALELPENRPTFSGNNLSGNAKGMDARITSDRQIIATQPITARIRYDAASYVNFTLQPYESSADLRDSLQLPTGYNPRTQQFAAQLRAQFTQKSELVDAVLKHFREQPFRYTLQPPLLGRDGIDDFLFTTKAGFCEHYAGAFVVLMRAAGIPSRVVTGYQGGEVNPVDGFMVVRQSDAHAWAEVWLQDRGWVRLDPTGAVAPNRIEQNLTSVLPRGTGALDGLVNFTVGRNSLVAKLRLNWDAMTNSWNQWVLNYNPDSQKNFLRALGFDDVDWRTLTALLFSVGTIVLAMTTLPLILNRQKRKPVDALYASLCQLMEKQGYARRIHEGPRDYRSRLTAADSTLATDKKEAVTRFLSCYEAAQYGTVDAALNSTVISQLKSLLAECR